MMARLRDAMDEQAWRAAQAPVDLGPVIAAGNRRRRVRGLAGAGVVGVVAAAVVFGGVQIVGTSDDAASARYANPSDVTARAATYASGSTIHYGEEEIDVGMRIRTFVQTDDGFVFTGPSGAVWFTSDGEGLLDHLGQSRGRAFLTVDDSGSYVAWVDGDPNEFVVYDTQSLESAARVPTKPGPGGGPYVYAIDGTSMYVLDSRGLSRIDIPTGKIDVLRDDIRSRNEIRDVEDGWILRDRNSGGLSGSLPLDTVMSRDPLADEPLTVADARDLSLDGRYVTTDVNDSEQIVDTRTNEEVVLDTSEYDFQSVSRWLDDDTVAVMTLKKPFSDPDISLLTCEVPSGECAVAAEDLPSNLQLPVGEHLRRD